MSTLLKSRSEKKEADDKPPSKIGRKINDLTIEQICYIAGILDGEGAIGISLRTGKKAGRRGYCFRPTICVCNTSRKLLDWLYDTTGVGSITNKNSNSPNENKHKKRWNWTLWCRHVEQLLKVVGPYLVIKCEQSKLVLEFINLLGKPKGRKGLSDEEWNLQEELYWKLKIINSRGNSLEKFIKSPIALKLPFLSNFLKGKTNA